MEYFPPLRIAYRADKINAVSIHSRSKAKIFRYFRTQNQDESLPEYIELTAIEAGESVDTVTV